MSSLTAILRQVSFVALFLVDILARAGIGPGSHDPSFDVGSAYFGAVGTPNFTSGVTLPDGSIVLGKTTSNFQYSYPNTEVLVHVLEDGRYDYSYGTTNRTAHSIGPLAYQRGLGLLVSNDGTLSCFDSNGIPDDSFAVEPGLDLHRIQVLAPLAEGGFLVARTGVSNLASGTSIRSSLLFKFRPNGPLDPRFYLLDGGFYAPLAQVDTNSSITALEVLDDGRILVAGRFGVLTQGNLTTNHLVRLLPDGAIDHSFVQPTNLLGSTNVSHLLGIGNGLVAVGADRSGQDRIVKLKSDGSSDPSFRDRITPGYYTPISNLVPAPDGSFIVIDALGSISRILPNGTRDTNRYPRLSTIGSVGVKGVLPLNDGGFVVYGGFQSINGVSRPGFAHLFPDGTVDLNFGRTGHTLSTLRGVIGSNTAPKSLVPLHDGILTLDGFDGVDGWSATRSIAKLALDGSLDRTFVPNWTTVVAGGKSVGFERGDGRVVLARDDGIWMTNNYLGHLVRLLPDGTLDRSFHPEIAPTATLSAVAMQSDEKILLAGTGLSAFGTNQAEILRLEADGAIDTSFSFEWPADLSSNAVVAALLVVGNGRVVMATKTGFVGGFDSSGRRDSAFQGLPELSVPYTIHLAALPGGDIYCAGRPVDSTASPFAPASLAHWKPDGTFDSQFHLSLPYWFNGVQAASEDRIVVFQYGSDTNPGSITRLFSDGSVDASFAVNDSPAGLQALAVVGDRIYISAVAKDYNFTLGHRYPHLFRVYNQCYSLAPPEWSGTGDNSAVIRFYAPPGGHYLFETSPDLLVWKLAVDQVVPVSGVVSFRDELGQREPTRFFRARLVH